jgi:histone-lysine N-methyltransferase SETMAR
MVMAFFDCRGLMYIHVVPRGAKINAMYIVKALDTFMKHFKKKRPEMASREWFFHWDNGPVHTAAVVQDWLAANQIQVLEHLPYFPDLAPADYFLFRRVKEELAGLRLTPESLKNTLEGVIRSISFDEFAAAFRLWLDQCNKTSAFVSMADTSRNL